MTDRFGLGISNCRPAAAVLDTVLRAEGIGAELAFIAEDVNCRDSFELCALSAARSSRIRIGPGVANPYTRNPTSLAMAVATLAEISEGRAMLGLGASSPSLIQGQMGISMGSTVEALREAATIVRGLLRGERVSFAGERFHYRDAHLEIPPVPSHVPIYFAAMGPHTLRLAGEVGDGVFLNVGASTDYIRWAVARVHEGARLAGRSPREVTIAAWITAYVTQDLDRGIQRAREWLATMLSVPRQGELLLRHGGFDSSILPEIRRHVHAYPYSGDRRAAGQAVPPEYAERMALIGDASRVAERLGEYRQAGVDVPVLSISALQALFT